MLKRLFLLQLPLLAMAALLIFLSARFITNFTDRLAESGWSSISQSLIVILGSLCLTYFLMWPIVFVFMKFFGIENEIWSTRYTSIINNFTGFVTLSRNYDSTRRVMMMRYTLVSYIIFGVLYTLVIYPSLVRDVVEQKGAPAAANILISMVAWPYKLTSKYSGDSISSDENYFCGASILKCETAAGYRRLIEKRCVDDRNWSFCYTAPMAIASLRTGPFKEPGIFGKDWIYDRNDTNTEVYGEDWASFKSFLLDFRKNINENIDISEMSNLLTALQGRVLDFNRRENGRMNSYGKKHKRKAWNDWSGSSKLSWVDELDVDKGLQKLNDFIKEHDLK